MENPGIMFLIAAIIGAIFVAGAYTPPSYDDVELTLSENYTAPSYDNVLLPLVETPTADDTCTCPSPSADWHIETSDSCNVTINCYNDGCDVFFENGTMSDMVNISAMIVADNFDYSNTNSTIHLHSNAYLNTS